jgi:arylsulfatase A-like enzyme
MIHVPLFFTGINTPKNKIIHDLVRSVDIFPTIFNMLGIDDSALKDKDGRSLVPMLEDKKLTELPAYFNTNPHKEVTLNDKVGIRTSKYKYFRAEIDKVKEINLYDLENDPQENNNIASENPEIVKSMEEILEKLTKNATIDEPEKLTKKQEKIVEEQLKEMGYI